MPEKQRQSQYLQGIVADQRYGDAVKTVTRRNFRNHADLYTENFIASCKSGKTARKKHNEQDVFIRMNPE